jgi:hypothetical protein
MKRRQQPPSKQPHAPSISSDLQARAKTFLQKPIPDGINYVPGSIAETLIATYAERGSVPDDAETAELLALAGMEAQAAADRFSYPAAAEYFRETSAILEAILAERI